MMEEGTVVKMEVETPSGPESRRKSLGLLKDITQNWSADPDKYGRSEDRTEPGGGGPQEAPGPVVTTPAAAGSAVPASAGPSTGSTAPAGPSAGSVADAVTDILPAPKPQIKMSSMEEESVRDRLRLRLLRQCADILDSEPRHTKETFRRAFLNKVRSKPTPD